MPTTIQRATASWRRQEARETERTFTDALFANRPDLGEGRIKAPPPRERVAERFGGGYRHRGGEYDWYFELAPEERKRIRENWMTSSRGALSPDEVEDLGLPIGEWLALTRGIDASRALATGRQLQAKRYGGRDPLAYLRRGDPDDEGRRVGKFATRRAETPDRYVDRGERVQFFTDSNGVVHPIRASYEHQGRYRAESAAERLARYGADEAF